MKQTKFSAPDELRQKIKEQAVKEDRSASAIIRKAVRAYLTKETK